MPKIIRNVYNPPERLVEQLDDWLAANIPELSAERFEAEWGPRCPDYDPDCPACRAWARRERRP